MGRNPVTWLGSPAFPDAARTALADTQLRGNLAHATATIRDKRAAAVAELPDWERLRRAGEAIKDDVLSHLDVYLTRLERSVTTRGGRVHWARDAAEANEIVLGLVRAAGAREVAQPRADDEAARAGAAGAPDGSRDRRFWHDAPDPDRTPQRPPPPPQPFTPAPADRRLGVMTSLK